MLKKLRYFTFLFLLLPCIMFAGTAGKIKGKVTDLTTGEPLVGATVKVMSAQKSTEELINASVEDLLKSEGTTLGAQTDRKGEFVIYNVPAGVYQIQYSYVGYKTVYMSDVRVNIDLTTEADMQVPAQGVTVATINVTAKRPLVDKNSTNATRIVTGEDLNAIPVRGINAALLTNPSVVQTNGVVTIRGGRPDEVGYYLEGVSISNPMTGGRAVTIVPEALEEVQVQAGGYTAEFGNANAGITRSQFKTGTASYKASLHYITDNYSFKSKDKLFSGDKTLGAYSFGYNEATATFSGPIPGLEDKVKFFILGNSNFIRDATRRAWPGMNLGRIGDKTVGDTVDFTMPAGLLPGNKNQSYTGTGTISFDFNPVLIRVSGTGTWTTFDNPDVSRNPGVIQNINNNRWQQHQTFNGATNLKLTYIISPEMFVEANVGYFRTTDKRFDPFLKDDFRLYGDSAANAKAGITNLQWTRSGSYSAAGNEKSIFGWSFNNSNVLIANYLKNKRENYSLSGAFSWMPVKEHSIKIGGEYNQYTIRQYSFNNETLLGLDATLDNNAKKADGDPTKLTEAQIFRNKGVNNYGYDELGNEITGGGTTGLEGAKDPIFAAAYIQDKMEYEDIVLSVGFRWDLIDTRQWTLVDPTQPEKSINKADGTLIPAGWVRTKAYTGISPRLGVSFPVTDKTVFHAQYGKFVQQSRLVDLYTGPYAFASNVRGGFFIISPFGLDLRPTKTTQYEIGFNQQIGENASFDITGYYKDIKDQIVYDQQDCSTPVFASYSILKNGDFATNKGLEITFNLRRTNRFSMNASLAFSDAKGTGSSPNGSRGVVGAPLDGVTIFRPAYISSLDYNTPLRGHLNLDYRFGKDDGGYLSEFGVSALFRFNSGHPYTLGTSSAQSLESDARNRQPLEPVNSSITPWMSQLDLRIDKTFRVADLLNVNLYVQVLNLFDSKNVENVFGKSGVATDDGTLSDPAEYQKMVALNGPNYPLLYRAMNIDYQNDYYQANTGSAGNYLYSNPREIRVGIRIDY